MDGAAEAGHGALGGAVAVLEPAAARPEVREIGRERLAADIEEPDRRKLALGVVASERAQEGRRRAEHRDLLADEPRQEIGPEAHRLVVEDDDRRAGRPREPHLLDARVVACARALRDAVVRCEPELEHVARDEVEERAVLDLDALWLARGARGVDDIRERVGGGG